MLAAAKVSPGYLMSSTTMQQSFDLVEKAVDTMQYAVMPSVDMKSGSIALKQAYHRFPHFYRLDAAADTGVVKSISGHTAMGHALEVMAKRIEKKEDIAPEAFEQFHEYKWLLTVAQQKALLGWVKNAVKKATEADG